MQNIQTNRVYYLQQRQTNKYLNKQRQNPTMSLSKSNTSNQSSISNLLTLSRESQQQIKSQVANQYYKKFISRLGFLFRIDTQDLDALYNKIVQCVNQSSHFGDSNDADIAELIELAKKLRYNHNLLKNMVEVLDQRFIRNKSNTANTYTNSNNQGRSQNLQIHSGSKKNLDKSPNEQLSMSRKRQARYQPSNREGQSYQNSYNQKRTKNKSQFSNNAENVKRKFQAKATTFANNPLQTLHQVKDQQEEDYSALFNNTLQMAKQQVRKKKQLQLSHQQSSFSTTNGHYIAKNNNERAYNNESTKQFLNKSKNKFEQRIGKIFDQMNKIKGQLYKIQSTNTSTSGNDTNVNTNPKYNDHYYNHCYTQSYNINAPNTQNMDNRHRIFNKNSSQTINGNQKQVKMKKQAYLQNFEDKRPSQLQDKSIRVYQQQQQIERDRQIENKSSRYEQDQSHQVFKQLGDDENTYYLQDTRYNIPNIEQYRYQQNQHEQTAPKPNPQPNTPPATKIINIPKLSLKQLYDQIQNNLQPIHLQQQGDSNTQNNNEYENHSNKIRQKQQDKKSTFTKQSTYTRPSIFHGSRMGTIKQTERDNENTDNNISNKTQTNNKYNQSHPASQPILNVQHSSPSNNRHRFSLDAGTETGGTRMAVQERNSSPKDQSQKSYNISNSNGTIIDKLNTANYHNSGNNSQLTYMPRTYQQTTEPTYSKQATLHYDYPHQDKIHDHKHEFQQQSISTTIMNASIQIANQGGLQQNRFAATYSGNGTKIGAETGNGTYQHIIDRNKESRQKIVEYMDKLDQRNRVLRGYVQRMEKSLGKDEAKDQEKPLQNKKLQPSINSNKISNRVYRDDQISAPKYIPTYQTETQQLNPLNQNQISDNLQPNQSNNNTNKIHTINNKNIAGQKLLNKTSSETLFNFKNSNNDHPTPNQHNKNIHTNNYSLSQASPTFKLFNQTDAVNNSYQKSKSNSSNNISNNSNNNNRNDKGLEQRGRTLQRNNNIQPFLLKGQQRGEDRDGYNQITYRGQLNNNYYLGAKGKQVTNKDHQHALYQNKRYSQPQQKQHSLQLTSQKSLNSLQDRITPTPSHHHSHLPASSPQHSFHTTTTDHHLNIIPRMTTHSLFEQTRNVESKIELSEDRGYRMKVPGEEIERIRGRVNEMFRKIKGIREGQGDPLGDLGIKEESCDGRGSDTSLRNQQVSVNNNTNAHVNHVQNKIQVKKQQARSYQVKKFQFKTSPSHSKQKSDLSQANTSPQQDKHQKPRKQLDQNFLIPSPKPLQLTKTNPSRPQPHSQIHSRPQTQKPLPPPLKQSSLIDQIQSTQIFPSIQLHPDRQGNRNYYANVFNNSYPVNHSVIVGGNGKGNGNGSEYVRTETRFTVGFQDVGRVSEDGNRISIGTANFPNSSIRNSVNNEPANMLSGSNSKDSNFSFSNHMMNKHNQQLVKKSYIIEQPNNNITLPIKVSRIQTTSSKQKNYIQFPRPQAIRQPVKRVIINRGPPSTRSSSISAQSKKSSISRNRPVPSIASTTCKTSFIPLNPSTVSNTYIKNSPPLPPKVTLIPQPYHKRVTVRSPSKSYQKIYDIPKSPTKKYQQTYIPKPQTKHLSRNHSQHILQNSHVTNYNNHPTKHPSTNTDTLSPTHQLKSIKSTEKITTITHEISSMSYNSPKNTAYKYAAAGIQTFSGKKNGGNVSGSANVNNQECQGEEQRKSEHKSSTKSNKSKKGLEISLKGTGQ